MRKSVLLWTAAALAVVFSSGVAILAILTNAPSAAEACTGETVYPSQNLAEVAKNSPPGTTFCLQDGTYKISSPVLVESGDTFVGVYSDSTRSHVTTDTARHVFYAGTEADGSENIAVGATIKNLTVSGAVGDAQCQPNCGRGIGGGQNLTVDNVRATANMNQGVGGTQGGLMVRNSVIDYNGSAAFSTSTNTNSSAGVKSANSLTIINSWVHHNWWNGVWCDEECNAFRVEGSTITDNGNSGVHDEISTGPAYIVGNIIQRNGWNDTVPSRRGGLLIVDSTNAEAYGNTFGGNFNNIGVEVGDFKARAPAVSNVSIHDNTMNSEAVVGCDRLGVSCYGNNRCVSLENRPSCVYEVGWGNTLVSLEPGETHPISPSSGAPRSLPRSNLISSRNSLSVLCCSTILLLSPNVFT